MRAAKVQRLARWQYISRRVLTDVEGVAEVLSRESVDRIHEEAWLRALTPLRRPTVTVAEDHDRWRENLVALLVEQDAVAESWRWWRSSWRRSRRWARRAPGRARAWWRRLWVVHPYDRHAEQYELTAAGWRYWETDVAIAAEDMPDELLPEGASRG